jgi:hypothetical protein
MRNAHKILATKPEGKRSLGRLGCRIHVQWKLYKSNFKGNKKIFELQKYIFLACLSVEFTSSFCPSARKTW